MMGGERKKKKTRRRDDDALVTTINIFIYLYFAMRCEDLCFIFCLFRQELERALDESMSQGGIFVEGISGISR